jgi:hypothetical protein
MLTNFVLQECFGNVMLKNECWRILWSQILHNKILEKWTLIHIVGWCISFLTSVFTWKLLLDNGECEYKCSLERIKDNVVYVKPCFVPIVG